MDVIRGRAEYLVDEIGIDPHREQAETIHKWAEEIIDAIDRIRVILQTIQDGEERSLEPVELRPVVSTEVERIASAYPVTTFETVVPAELSVQANELLATILNNLLTNAVEHNDPDGLRVTVEAVEAEESVSLRVTDTGNGISDERKEAVFSRGESSRSRTDRGGLGLFMVETVVNTYGGSVWIEDNEPCGTAVCMALPKP